MTKRILIPATAILLLGGAAIAIAAGGNRHGDHEAHHQARLDRLFDAYDLNTDGAISEAEIVASRDARFALNDVNNDGKLTSDEIRAAIMKRAEARANRMVERMLERSDADNDGVVSLAEFEDTPRRSGRKMMKRLDTDGDGVITRAEAEAAKGWRHRSKHKDSHDKKAETGR